jgi:uncharacterized protein (TIGR03437 family)
VQLGDVEVTFDGIPAAILRTSPGRVIVATPANLPISSQDVTFTSVQLSYNGVPSNSVLMPVFPSAPGLLTSDLLDPLYRGNFADGNVQNEDGVLNDADHPAAAGSTITLFATGMGATGATNPPIAPGSIATSLKVTPIVPVYSSWKGYSNPPVAGEAVYSIPGFVSAIFQIPIHVPLQGVGGVDVGNGVHRAPVGLVFSVSASSVSPRASNPASNFVGVYVK